MGQPVRLTGTQRVLYVDDTGNNAVEVLKYGTWANLGAITNGIDQPAGNWVDRNGNLYVANDGNSTVTEYDPSGNLIFKYDVGMANPVDVTTDRRGNVYELDYGGTVNEYAQQSDSVAESCDTGLTGFGVAIGKHGSVIVDISNLVPPLSTTIMVYPGGLLVHGFHCANAVFQVDMKHSGYGGIALDNQANWVVGVTSQSLSAVDVIAPPYTAFSGTLGSGWSQPDTISIDRANTQAYVTENGTGDVRVISYPGGSTIATLGSANGIGFASGAVDSKNYVP